MQSQLGTGQMFVLSLVLALGACSGPDDAIPRKSYSHPGGLTVQAPATYSVKQLERGFLFGPPGTEGYRYPTYIRIELREGNAPAGGWPYFSLGGIARYRLAKDADQGASGAPEYTLTAWDQTATGHLWMQQVINDELPVFVWHFDTAWSIFHSARIGTE